MESRRAHGSVSDERLKWAEGLEMRGRTIRRRHLLLRRLHHPLLRLPHHRRRRKEKLKLVRQPAEASVWARVRQRVKELAKE